MSPNNHVINADAADNGNGHYSSPVSSPAFYEVQSEEVQDIMTQMPRWIIRRGTAVLFVLLIVLFIGAYFIHYPDVIVTNISITSSNPPIKLIAQTNGQIESIFVKNNQQVKKGERIMLLENTADYADVLSLKNILNRLDTSLSLAQTLKSISFNQYARLGTLQNGYADLYQSVRNT